MQVLGYSFTVNISKTLQAERSRRFAVPRRMHDIPWRFMFQGWSARGWDSVIGSFLSPWGCSEDNLTFTVYSPQFVPLHRSCFWSPWHLENIPEWDGTELNASSNEESSYLPELSTLHLSCLPDAKILPAYIAKIEMTAKFKVSFNR